MFRFGSVSIGIIHRFFAWLLRWILRGLAAGGGGMRRPCFFHLAEGGLDTLCWNLIPTGGTRYLVQSLFCVRMRAGVFGRSGIFQKEKKGMWMFRFLGIGSCSGRHHLKSKIGDC